MESKKKMFQIFNKLTSGKPEIREQPNSTPQNLPVWFQILSTQSELLISLMKEDSYKKEIKEYIDQVPVGSIGVINQIVDEIAEYIMKPWTPLTDRRFHHLRSDANRIMRSRERAEPLYVNRRMRSPERPGLADAFRDTCRIKSFKLKHAILYSYMYDMRFIIFLTIIINFSIWIGITPEPLLGEPGVLSSTADLQFLKKVVEDTYINNRCTDHPDITSPCPCGEPLNNEVKIMFPEKPFDPLNIDNQPSGKIKTISLMVGTIILAIALTESVSEYGIYINLNE